MNAIYDPFFIMSEGDVINPINTLEFLKKPQNSGSLYRFRGHKIYQCPIDWAIPYATRGSAAKGFKKKLM
jgi:hypothetical protein